MKVLPLTAALTLFATPAAAEMIYLECNELAGTIVETKNVEVITRKVSKTSHNQSPTKALTEKQLKKHKVSLNPGAGTGTWSGVTTPTFYPTHISFSKQDRAWTNPGSDTTIFKIFREKLAEGKTFFERIHMTWTTGRLPTLRQDWHSKIVASGFCEVVKSPKSNLF